MTELAIVDEMRFVSFSFVVSNAKVGFGCSVLDIDDDES